MSDTVVQTLTEKRDEVLETLTQYKAARDSILSGGAVSYRVDDGDSSVEVTNLSLRFVEKRIAELQAEYDALTNEINGHKTRSASFYVIQAY